MNLADKAILEAKQVREAALKMANEEVVQKFAPRIKEAVTRILDEEDDDPNVDLLNKDPNSMTPASGAPLPGAEAGTDPTANPEGAAPTPMAPPVPGGPASVPPIDNNVGKGENGLHSEVAPALANGETMGADEEIEISFPDILDALASEEGEDNFDTETFDSPETEDHLDAAEEIRTNMRPMAEEMSMASGAVEGSLGNKKEMIQEEEPKTLSSDNDEDEYLLTDEDLDELASEYVKENFEVDHNPVASGKLFTGLNKKEEEREDVEAILKLTSDSEEEKKKALEANKELQKVVKTLEEENKRLKGKLKEAVVSMRESNNKNAILFYMNKTLIDDSLNEKQKAKIVESLSKATSLEQAKTLYESLSSTVKEGRNLNSNNKTTSLNEAISSERVFNLPNNSNRQKLDESASDFANDPVKRRMMELAGIKLVPKK